MDQHDPARDAGRQDQDPREAADEPGTAELTYLVIAVAALALIGGTGTAGAQKKDTAPRKTAAEYAADVVRAMTEYRAVVERHLPGYEAAVTRAAEELSERRKLHKAGFLEIAYVEAAERALAQAQQELEEARLDLAMADRMIIEAGVQEQLARLGPLARGGFQETATLVRFNGTARWSLDDLPKLEQLFSEAFGRRLPVSAVGQTTVHDRLGLDHRGAVDVAVHPDSPEGRWLMDHLRRAGMPFIAVRAAIPGASTGAHVHIGAPSGRVRAR